MKRKTTVLTLSAMLFALCFSVEAQQTGPSDLAGLLMVAALSATVGLVLFLIWALARISHNGIISRAASAENAFTSMIRGDQHYCHGDRQAIGRRWQRFGFVRANARFAGIAIPSLPIRQITRR